MQIVSSKSNIVEKVFRDKEGRLVRARFTVYENAGRIKARLLDFSYIETLKGTVASLVSFVKEKVKILVQVLEFSFETPTLAFQTIYTSGSKPRAPTL